MKKLLFFLCFPVIFIFLRIQYVTNIYQIISYILFVIVNVSISVSIYFCCHTITKRNKTKCTWLNVVILVISSVSLDQIAKFIVYKCDLDVEIIGKLLKIEITKNIHQMAGLNFLDIQMEESTIVMFKGAMILLILGVFILKKNKSDEYTYALVLFLAAGTATFIDSVCWGYTLDYVYFYKLTCYDLKDFYVDAAIGCVLMDLARNYSKPKDLTC